MQIVKNLLSNAMKFTAQGSVRLHVGAAMLRLDAPIIRCCRRPSSVVEFAVTDTGIGISAGEAEDHLRGVPAGRRRHGAQVRRHRPGARHQPRARAPARRRDPPQELAGQRQHVHALSTARLPGRGLRPRRHADVHQAPSAALPSPIALPAPHVERVEDDRETIEEGDEHGADRRGRSALRARCCSKLRTRQGLQGAGRAERRAMRCRWRASTSPTAVTLDVFLPDMLGWTVLNQLKHDPATRHIPVQMLTVEEERQYGLERGAFSFMTKPSTHRRLRGRVRRASRTSSRRACASCWWSKTIRPSR